MFKFLFSFCIGICLLCTSCSVQTLSDEELYANAVHDSQIAKRSKLHDLVTLNLDDPSVTYIGNKVLMATFHNAPKFYQKGNDEKLSINALWLVSYKELETKLSVNSNCSNKRIIQILGAKVRSSYSYLSLLLIDPNKLIRPAYLQDPFVNAMSLTLSTNDKSFERWFNDMKSKHDYPWTALGYTYDWGVHGDVYGLSEFILRKNDYYHVVETSTMDNFIASECKVKY